MCNSWAAAFDGYSNASSERRSSEDIRLGSARRWHFTEVSAQGRHGGPAKIKRLFFFSQVQKYDRLIPYLDTGKQTKRTRLICVGFFWGGGIVYLAPHMQIKHKKIWLEWNNCKNVIIYKKFIYKKCTTDWVLQAGATGAWKLLGLQIRDRSRDASTCIQGQTRETFDLHLVFTNHLWPFLVWTQPCASQAADSPRYPTGHHSTFCAVSVACV